MVFLSVGPQRGSTKALPIGRAQLVTRKTDEEFYASFGNIVGGVISPVISNLVLDGLEAVVHGSPGHRRVHHINYVRWADDVRHITWRQIPFTERRGSEDKTFGSTTYLEAKAEGDSSMSLKRRASEGVYGAALQDPRDTVRATLPKPQFPAMEAYIPCRQRLLAGSPR
jgi:hypothetical protein